MKKIVIAVDTYFPKKDGVVIFLKNIVPLLAKKYFITILCPDFDGKRKFFDISNVNEIRFAVDDKKAFSGYSPVKKTAKMKEIVKREIRNCDLVFSQDIADLGRMSIHYAKSYKKPVVSYVHQISWQQLGSMLKNPIKRAYWTKVVKSLAKKMYEKSSLLFVPSKKTAIELKEAGIEKEKAIIHLGVNLDKFAPPKDKAKAKVEVNIDPSKNVIGYCGRISEEKDLITLRDAFFRIKEKFPNTILLIVGGGSGEYFQKIKEISDTIITGFVDDVTPYLRAMDIFVLPSITETTSLATIEAMATGIPVIATPVGRIQEYIINNENGYIFSTHNDETLAKRIEMLLENPRKRNNIGNNARKSILKFSWNITVEQMSELFEKLLHQT